MEQFKRLSTEKQDLILNAGFICFARNGYKKASMADIAGVAGVSKASLFQYFGSKKDLYLYLYELCCNMIINAATEKMQQISDDFFERMARAQEIKMKVALQYSGMYDFLYTSFSETDPEIANGINISNAGYISDGYGLLLDGINWDKFKPGIDLEMVTNTVTWIAEGYSKSMVGQNKSRDQLNEDAYKYLDMLKQCMYKEEYLNEDN